MHQQAPPTINPQTSVESRVCELFHWTGAESGTTQAWKSRVAVPFESAVDFSLSLCMYVCMYVCMYIYVCVGVGVGAGQCSAKTSGGSGSGCLKHTPYRFSTALELQCQLHVSPVWTLGPSTDNGQV